MIISWDNIGQHVLRVSDNDSFHLFATIEDEQAYLFLELNGEKHELAWDANDFCRPGASSLNSYDILEYYSAVVTSATSRCCQDCDMLDIEAIKNELLPGFWETWHKYGHVSTASPDDIV